MTNTYVKQLVDQYRNRGVVIDTNLFLLWIVGMTNPKRIEKFKRTRKYTVADYRQLTRFMSQFTKIITTPNIVTEVYNLANQLESRDRTRCLNWLKKVLESKIIEQYVPSSDIIQDERFTDFGVTDCGIKQISLNTFLVLSDDLKLVSYLRQSGVDAVNFENLDLAMSYLKD